MEKVKALIITGFGINCEEEMAAAYKLAGAEAEIVHLNDIFSEKKSKMILRNLKTDGFM